jgi:hypothetical protein
MGTMFDTQPLPANQGVRPFNIDILRKARKVGGALSSKVVDPCSEMTNGVYTLHCGRE